MKVRRELESPIFNFSLSPNKTLRTAESNPDQQGSPRSRSSSDRYTSINDDQVMTLIEQKNYVQASYLLHELIEEIQSDYQNADESKKSHSLYICLFNLGVVYWKLRKFQETEKYLNQAMQYLQIHLSFCQYKEQHLAYSLELIKLSLQQSVVLSQNGKHWKAAEISDQAVNKLFECFRMKMMIVREMLVELKKDKKNKLKNRVDFKKIVLNEAKEKLKYLCEFQKSYKLIDESTEELDEIINNLYTWKRNLENNEKFIKMSLKIQNNPTQEYRNILGISKAPDWIQYFNIGSIMTLQPMKMQSSPNLDTFYLLSNNKILELILYTSVAYFTVATEIRFMQIEDESLNPSEKFMKMNDNPKILKCKILHLKAIELVARFMPNSNLYVSHLISSFNKNYKFYMEKIDEETSSIVENNSQAILRSKAKKKKKQIKNLSNSKIQHRRQHSILKSGSSEHFCKKKMAEINIHELKRSKGNDRRRGKV